MDTNAIVLKTDSRGRVRTPPERRAALLAEFARSGISAAKFAALAGVRYQTFATWVQQQKRRGPGTPAKGPRPVRFTQVVTVAAPTRAQPQALRVLLPGGAVIELTGPAQVPLAAQFIQALLTSAMLSFNGSLKVFVALEPIDMRKGFEGLCMAVGEKLKADVRSCARNSREGQTFPRRSFVARVAVWNQPLCHNRNMGSKPWD